MSRTGTLYLIQPAHVAGSDIFKIGYTQRDMSLCLRAFQQGTVVHRSLPCKNIGIAKKMVLRKLFGRFARKSALGSDYVEGNIDVIIDAFDKFVKAWMTNAPDTDNESDSSDGSYESSFIDDSDSEWSSDASYSSDTSNSSHQSVPTRDGASHLPSNNIFDAFSISDVSDISDTSDTTYASDISDTSDDDASDDPETQEDRNIVNNIAPFPVDLSSLNLDDDKDTR